MDFPSRIPRLTLQRPHRILPRLSHRPSRRSSLPKFPLSPNPLAQNNLPHFFPRKETLRLSRRTRHSINRRSDNFRSTQMANKFIINYSENPLSGDEVAL